LILRRQGKTPRRRFTERVFLWGRGALARVTKENGFSQRQTETTIKGIRGELSWRNRLDEPEGAVPERGKSVPAVVTGKMAEIEGDVEENIIRS
jgi:hypothetical protein